MARARWPMFSATDWALKRVLKFLLKRSLGRYLRNELDLQQLDVQLGSGTLELRDVLLNCDNINQQLVSRTRLAPSVAHCIAPTYGLEQPIVKLAHLCARMHACGAPCAMPWQRRCACMPHACPLLEAQSWRSGPLIQLCMRTHT